MDAIQYNPFQEVVRISAIYFSLVTNELSNDNACRYYASGWDNHERTISRLKEFTLNAWFRHCEYTIATFGPSVLIAIAALKMFSNQKLSALPPSSCDGANCSVDANTALWLQAKADELHICENWIDWKAYLELLLMEGKTRKFAIAYRLHRYSRG